MKYWKISVPFASLLGISGIFGGMESVSRFELIPHWWEASALTTTSS